MVAIDSSGVLRSENNALALPSGNSWEKFFDRNVFSFSAIGDDGLGNGTKKLSLASGYDGQAYCYDTTSNSYTIHAVNASTNFTAPCFASGLVENNLRTTNYSIFHINQQKGGRPEFIGKPYNPTHYPLVSPNHTTYGVDCNRDGIKGDSSCLSGVKDIVDKPHFVILLNSGQILDMAKMYSPSNTYNSLTLNPGLIECVGGGFSCVEAGSGVDSMLVSGSLIFLLDSSKDILGYIKPYANYNSIDSWRTHFIAVAQPGEKISDVFSENLRSFPSDYTVLIFGDKGTLVKASKPINSTPPHLWSFSSESYTNRHYMIKDIGRDVIIEKPSGFEYFGNSKILARYLSNPDNLFKPIAGIEGGDTFNYSIRFMDKTFLTLSYEHAYEDDSSYIPDLSPVVKKNGSNPNLLIDINYVSYQPTDSTTPVFGEKEVYLTASTTEGESCQTKTVVSSNLRPSGTRIQDLQIAKSLVVPSISSNIEDVYFSLCYGDSISALEGKIGKDRIPLDIIVLYEDEENQNYYYFDPSRFPSTATISITGSSTYKNIQINTGGNPSSSDLLMTECVSEGFIYNSVGHCDSQTSGYSYYRINSQTPETQAWITNNATP